MIAVTVGGTVAGGRYTCCIEIMRIRTFGFVVLKFRRLGWTNRQMILFFETSIFLEFFGAN